MGQIIKLRQYPDAAFRDVTAPNADTLYTTAFFDVGKEPWVLSIPDMKDRYFLLPMLDGWTNVFQVPGKRTTGTGAQTYAITGPGWKGTLPAGVKEYKSPTSIVWLLGRIYCTGTPEDYAEVHKLQDEFKLVPLSSYGKPYTPPPGNGRSVHRHEDGRARAGQPHGRGGVFHAARKLMKDNPPAAADAPELAKFARIGIVPGQDFDASKLKADFVKRIPEIAFDRIMLQFKINKDVKDDERLGLHDQDRASTAPTISCGRSSPRSGLAPTGRRMRSIRHRRRTPTAGPTTARTSTSCTSPRASCRRSQGFWSLTMYDANYFFVNNPLNRYSISARQNLKTNPDGSTDLYIQKDSPGQGQGIELAAGTCRQVHPDAAACIGRTRSSPSIIDGIVENPGGEEGRLNDVRAGGRRHLMIAAGISLISLKPGSMYPQTHEFDHHA